MTFSAPIVQTALLSPSIRFGSFSDKWADMIEELPACVTTANTIKGRVLFDQSPTGAAQIEDGNQTSTKFFHQV